MWKGVGLMTERDRTPLYFRLVVRLIRPFPHFDFIFIKPLRAKAVHLLRLVNGDRVLDLGCGPGGSFPYLRSAVGGSGEVVGVEISSEVAINARRRIEAHRWENVKMVVGPAASVVLPGTFDGALMFGAPDVYGSAVAMKNVAAHLKPGARIVFFGAKASQRRMGWLLNGALRILFSKMSFDTTPSPGREPWSVAALEMDELVIEEYFMGWMFLASGVLRGGPDSLAVAGGPAVQAAKCTPDN
jgi:SAM-dependent methyltransferase